LEKGSRRTESKFGHFNVLVNNAGILGPIKTTTEISESEYLKVIDINQNSIFYGMKYTIPSMLKSGIGSIVDISSAAGIVAIPGYPSLAYMGSKFAVRGLTKLRQWNMEGIILEQTRSIPAISKRL